MKILIITYFAMSITSISRDFVDEQCSLYKSDILPMLFLTPIILIYCVVEKIYNILTVKEQK